MNTIKRLEKIVAKRANDDPKKSYVAKLNARGVKQIGKKLGEEAVEVVIAALVEDREALVGEAADLVFHLIMLLEAKGVRFDEVLAELERREGKSGLAEKAERQEKERAKEKAK